MTKAQSRSGKVCVFTHSALPVPGTVLVAGDVLQQHTGVLRKLPRQRERASKRVNKCIIKMTSEDVVLGSNQRR